MKTILTIDGDKTTIQQAGDDSSYTKDIATKDLIELFQSKNASIETPLLPAGTMKYVTKDSKEYVLLIQDAREVTIRYNIDMVYDQVYQLGDMAYAELEGILDVNGDLFDYSTNESFNEEYDEYESSRVVTLETVMPKTAWFVRVHKNHDGGVINGTEQVFALKDSIVDETSELFLYPFSNVYDSHRICWGNPHPTINSLMHIGGLQSMFLHQPFNLDLTIHNVHQVDGIDESINPDALFLHLMLHLKKKRGVSFDDRLEFMHRHMLKISDKQLIPSFKRFCHGDDHI